MTVSVLLSLGPQLHRQGHIILKSGNPWLLMTQLCHVPHYFSYSLFIFVEGTTSLQAPIRNSLVEGSSGYWEGKHLIRELKSPALSLS